MTVLSWMNLFHVNCSYFQSFEFLSDCISFGFSAKTIFLGLTIYKKLYTISSRARKHSTISSFSRLNLPITVLMSIIETLRCQAGFNIRNWNFKSATNFSWSFWFLSRLNMIPTWSTHISRVIMVVNNFFDCIFDLLFAERSWWRVFCLYSLLRLTHSD